MYFLDSQFFLNHSVKQWIQEEFLGNLSSLPPENEVWDKVMFSQACVSHSVQGGEVSVWCHFLSDCLVTCSLWGDSVSGPIFILRGLCFWSHVPAGGERGSLSSTQKPPLDRDPRMVKSGWYASYWNAFLFGVDISTSYAQIPDSESRSAAQSVILRTNFMYMSRGHLLPNTVYDIPMFSFLTATIDSMI